MQKILLYYIFTPLSDPDAVCLWQKTLCQSLGLKGRILLSEHGLNGTVGGDIEALKRYVTATKQYPAFRSIAFKWSDGSADDFPRLSVKVRSEIVTFGAADELQVTEKGIVGGGKHLTPQQVHELVKERGEDVIFFDGRNAYEAAVGKFKNAVVPQVNNTRDFLTELEKPEYQALKDKPIVTYCTGGIRCEVLSALMKNRGFEEVYQIDGGIAKYGEQFGDDGLWEGALYVFDDRVTTKFSQDAKDIGSCVHCDGKTSRYINCANKQCNQLILVCQDCNQQTYCTTCAKQPAGV
ncbi:MAG: rhodanese-like domain protein [Candidatus Saccharibacteria bacterium]|nr:rhodanese-like domain protein [Candidatus Saccharibacteria bacterium]